MIKKIIAIVFCGAILSGCTDADNAKFSTFNNPQHIQCYSGGKLIYEGDSTGKVLNEDRSDGYYFKDKATDKLVEISADCIFMQI